jgi:hypothetical protein
MLAGAVIGFGISTYETAVNGVDWAKDEAHWLAGGNGESITISSAMLCSAGVTQLAAPL